MNGITLVLDAIAFAEAAHRGQTRGDGVTPYIEHPVALTRLLAAAGIDDPVSLAAAALHDTIEDCGITPEALAARFGPEVAALVSDLTNPADLDRAARARWQADHMARMSAAGRLIKLADQTCNLRDLAAAPPLDWDQARRLAYRDKAAAVAAGARGLNPYLDAAFEDAYAAVA